MYKSISVALVVFITMVGIYSYNIAGEPQDNLGLSVFVEQQGGTNQNSYTTGDILYSDATDSLAKLGIGSNTEVLTIASGIPSWAAAVGGDPNVILTTVDGTTYLQASTTANAWLFNTGFVSQASSTIVGDSFVTGNSTTTGYLDVEDIAGFVTRITSATISSEDTSLLFKGNPTNVGDRIYFHFKDKNEGVTFLRIIDPDAPGNNYLEVTGDILPDTDDGGSLGVSTTEWSDLFLNTGGVINWEAGNVTLTHSAGLLTLSGNLTVGNASGEGVHIGTTGVFITSDQDGAITFLGESAGFDEDFTINLDDTENTAVITSSTGLTKFDFVAIGLELDANINLTLGAETLDHDGTDFVFSDTISLTEILISADRINDFANQAGLADGDSANTDSDSGLEVVSNSLTLLRGCSDNQILKWDETADDWNCEADGGGGGDPGLIIEVIGGDVVFTASSTAASYYLLEEGFVSQASSTVDGDFTVTGTCTGCGASASPWTDNGTWLTPTNGEGIVITSSSTIDSTLTITSTTTIIDDFNQKIFVADTFSGVIGLGAVPDFTTGGAGGGLYIFQQSVGGTLACGEGTAICIEDNNGPRIVMYSGTSGNPAIEFGDRNNLSQGEINYENGGDFFTFSVGSSDQVVLDNNQFFPSVDSDLDLGSSSFFFDETYTDELVLQQGTIGSPAADQVRLAGLDLSAGDSGLLIRTENDTDHLFASKVGIATTTPTHGMVIVGGLCIDNGTGDCGSMVEDSGSATTTGNMRVIGTLDSSDITFRNLVDNEVIFTLTEGDRVGEDKTDLVLVNMEGENVFIFKQDGTFIARNGMTAESNYWYLLGLLGLLGLIRRRT